MTAYNRATQMCVRAVNTPDPGKNPDCKDCGKGNPIYPGYGNKMQREVDMNTQGNSPLRMIRVYNSRHPNQLWNREYGPGTSRIGSSWSSFYERSIKVNSGAGLTVATVFREDSKHFYFTLAGAAYLPEADVADKLERLTDGSGNHTGWRYTVAATEDIELFDALGQLLSITSQTGIAQTLVYSDGTAAAPTGGVIFGTATPLPAGLVLTVTDSFGKQLGFNYDALSRMVRMIDPAGGTYQYTYDATNNLSSVTSPDNKTRAYIYNEPVNTANFSQPNALTGIVDENNIRQATFKYNNSRRAESTEYVGNANKYTSTTTGPYFNATVVDPLSTTSTYEYVRVLGVVKTSKITQPCGTVGCTGTVSSIMSYDANGNMSSRTDFNNNRTNYLFDLTRNLEISRTEGLTAAGATTPQTRTISTTWHPTYRIPATITEPTTAGSKVTTFTHDTNGNVLTKSIAVGGNTRTWTYTYDPFGRVLTATDPRNNTATNTYYPNTAAQNSAIANSRGMLASVTNAANHTTTITSYNAHGQPLSITDANSLVTSMAYDARQRLTSRNVGGETTTYDYDGVGQLTKVTLPDNSFLQYTYDGAHRLTEIKDGLNNRVVYTLDNMGNRTKEDYADPANVLSRTRSRVYDALNRLQKDIGGATPATQITQYSYDNNGNPTGTIDPLNRSTTQSYDALNRLLQVIDPFNGAAAPTKYEYDAQDNLTKVTDPKNLATVYAYNGFNELTSQTSPDTGSTGFTYDAAGNLQTKTDARSVTVTYAYDALNRVATISYPAYQTDPAELVTYTYDTCTNGKGRLCSITDKTGTTAYSYDLKGRVTSKAQTTLAFTQTIGYRYNAAGQMDEMTLPSGKKVAYSYLNNRITGLTYDGQPIVKNADYEPFGPVGEWLWGNDSVSAPNKHTRYFDLDGRTTKIESGPVSGAGSIEPTIIVYDAASRITDLQKLTANAIDPAKSTTYGYDNLDRLNSVTPNAGNPNPTRGFTYDGVGNRLTSTIAASTTNYGYGTTSHRLNTLTGAITQTYSYDADGNRTGDGTQTWSYGGNNRPITIALPGAVTVQAGINALGQRVTKSVNGTLTRFIYDEGGRLIGEYDLAGKAKQETIWFNDLPVAVIK